MLSDLLPWRCPALTSAAVGRWLSSLTVPKCRFVGRSGHRARLMLVGLWAGSDRAFRVMSDDSGFDTLHQVEGLILAYLLGFRKETWPLAQTADWYLRRMLP